MPDTDSTTIDHWKTDPLLRVLRAAEALALPALLAKRGAPRPDLPDQAAVIAEMFSAALSFAETWRGSRAEQFGAALRAIAIGRARTSWERTRMSPEVALRSGSPWARAAEALGVSSMDAEMLAAAKACWDALPEEARASSVTNIGSSSTDDAYNP